MDDLAAFCCQHEGCPDYGKRGHDNLTVTARYGPPRRSAPPPRPGEVHPGHRGGVGPKRENPCPPAAPPDDGKGAPLGPRPLRPRPPPGGQRRPRPPDRKTRRVAGGGLPPPHRRA